MTWEDREPDGVSDPLLLDSDPPIMKVEITLNDGGETLVYYQHYYDSIAGVEKLIKRITGHDFESFRLSARGD